MSSAHTHTHTHTGTVHFYETLRFLPQYCSKWRLRTQRTPHPPLHLPHLSCIPRAGIWPLLPACPTPASMYLCVFVGGCMATVASMFDASIVCRCVFVLARVCVYCVVRASIFSLPYLSLSGSRSDLCVSLFLSLSLARARARARSMVCMCVCAFVRAWVLAHRISLQADDFLSACLFLLSAACAIRCNVCVYVCVCVCVHTHVHARIIVHKPREHARLPAILCRVPVA